MIKMLTTKDFEYDLPEELIAQTPLKDRSSSRFLLVNRQNDELKDTVEKTLLEMADDGTFMEIAEKYADYGLVDSVCLGK